MRARSLSPFFSVEMKASRGRQDDEMIAERVGGVGVGREMPSKVLADRGDGVHEAVAGLALADGVGEVVDNPLHAIAAVEIGRAHV